MTDSTKQGTETCAEDLLGFLDGGEPPVFEDWGGRGPSRGDRSRHGRASRPG